MLYHSLKSGVCAAAIACSAGTAAAQDILLTVDLTVVNQVTISATSGVSGATVTGSVFTGVYLSDFYNAGAAGLGVVAGAGDLSSAANASDGSPSLFNAVGNTGLNIWAFSADTDASFTAGSQAFSGSGTFDLDAAQYADMLAGNSFGTIFFPADTDDDLAGATALGGYRVIVPTTGVLPAMGLGLAAATRRRR